MLRSRLLFALCAAMLGVAALVEPVHAQSGDRPGSLSEVALPNGLRAALAAIDDPVTADRSQFLLEFIRRVHQGPPGADYGDDAAKLQALVGHLDGPVTQGWETLPLPLTPATWIEVVFGGSVTEAGLVAAILRSRPASLLYCGLLALDEPTRAWLGTEPSLLAELAQRHAAALVVAGPALHVSDGRVHAPGGEEAEVIWQALVGRSVREPAEFVRALLGQQDGRLAYFFAATAQLTPPQLQLLLDLKSSRARRVRVTRRVHAVFQRLVTTWRIADRPFWRPAVDPALLVSELHVDDTGNPILPGNHRFWKAVLANQFTASESRDLTSGAALDVAWLMEQVFNDSPDARRRRYRVVLFASRMLSAVTPDNARDGVEAVRAAESYPALVAVLERAGLTELRPFALAARRAAELSALRDPDRAFRALVQFQGTLALVTRAAARGGLPPDGIATTVTSLAEVNLGDGGEYEGALVRWLDGHIQRSRPEGTLAPVFAAPSCELLYAAAPGRMECDLLRLIAGRVAAEPRIVDWEGTRYRVDFAGSEVARLGRLLGEDARPFLSSARALLETADALLSSRLDGEGLRQQAEALERVLGAFDAGPEVGAIGDLPAKHQATLAKLHGLALEGDVRGAKRLGAQVRGVADDLFARGLLEFVYATALGHPDRITVSAGAAARRHDFGLRGTRPERAWQLPTVAAERVPGWRIMGSLLGLDVRLAEFSLIRLSSRPVTQAPTLYGEDRRLLTEAVALVEPASLTEADRQTIVTAIQKGRARLAAARSEAEAAALADEIRLSAGRRALLVWVVAHDPDRTSAFLSPGELLWLGLEGKPVDPGLHAWGAPGEPRLGCLCLRLLDRRPWEALAGRSHVGLLASGFPDLNLRLAELLAELGMPAPMLGPVLASATREFLDTAQRRHPDDRRGLVEFVHELSMDRVEQYLSLLTTEGPLVRMGQTTDAATGTSKPEVPR